VASLAIKFATPIRLKICVAYYSTWRALLKIAEKKKKQNLPEPKKSKATQAATGKTSYFPFSLAIDSFVPRNFLTFSTQPTWRSVKKRHFHKKQEQNERNPAISFVSSFPQTYFEV